MTEDEVRKRIAQINVWKRGDARAPHKPLLILMALGAVPCVARGVRAAPQELPS
jgi:predicted restriction endonuclease